MVKTKIIRITNLPGTFRGILGGQLKFMSKYFEVIAISSPGDALLDVGDSQGVKTYAVQIKRKPSVINDLISIYKLYRIFRKEKPTIVHTHNPKAGMVGMMAAYCARVPLRLHTVAGLPLMTKKGWTKKLLIYIETITYRFATHVYPNSYGLKDYILSLNIINPSKLNVIGNGSTNGIDLNYYNPELISESEIDLLKENHNIEKQDFVYIFIGRIVKDKGIGELVLAFKLLLKKYSTLKLLILGRFEDDLYPINPELKSFLFNSPDVIFAGFQKDIRPFLKLADVFVHPSYREGFPNVVLQACAFNKPLIVTDINGSNEIIKHKENGLIVPIANSEKLKEAMEILFLDKEQFNKYKKNNRELVKINYSRPVIWEKFYQEYSNHLSKL